MNKEKSAAAQGPLILFVTLAALGALALVVLSFIVIKSVYPDAALNNVATTALGVVGIPTASAGLVLAIRRQKTTEQTLQHNRADLAQRAEADQKRISHLEQAEFQRIAETTEQRERELQSDLHGRYVTAATQIAHEHAAVRIAGVYAMAQLAGSWKETDKRQACVDVLCAYLRLPLRTVPRENAISIEDSGDVEVRKTIEGLISRHLNWAAKHHWGEVDIDLSGAHLSNLSLVGAKILGRLDISNAVTRRADFTGMHVREMFSANDTTFIDGANFNRAVFHSQVMFGGSIFKGNANFKNIEFASAGVFCAWFSDVDFQSNVSFENTHFHGRVNITGLNCSSESIFAGSRREKKFDLEDIGANFLHTGPLQDVPDAGPLHECKHYKNEERRSCIKKSDYRHPKFSIKK